MKMNNTGLRIVLVFIPNLMSLFRFFDRAIALKIKNIVNSPSAARLKEYLQSGKRHEVPNRFDVDRKRCFCSIKLMVNIMLLHKRYMRYLFLHFDEYCIYLKLVL